MNLRESSKESPRWSYSWSVTYRERLKEPGLFSPEKKRFRGSNSSLNVLKRLLIQPKRMAGE